MKRSHHSLRKLMHWLPSPLTRTRVGSFGSPNVSWKIWTAPLVAKGMGASVVPCPPRRKCGGRYLERPSSRRSSTDPIRHATGTRTLMTDQPAGVPDNTAVRTALWRALHVEIDPPPHVLDDRLGLELV